MCHNQEINRKIVAINRKLIHHFHVRLRKTWLSAASLFLFPETSLLLPMAFWRCLRIHSHHLPPTAIKQSLMRSNGHKSQPPCPWVGYSAVWVPYKFPEFPCGIKSQVPSVGTCLGEASGCLPFPFSLLHCPPGISWDHLPNILLVLEFLSRGLLFRKLKLRWVRIKGLFSWARITHLNQVTQARSARQSQLRVWTSKREVRDHNSRSAWSRASLLTTLLL